VNLQYDILDFIKPCSQHVLQRLQEERHFTVYPSLPDFITPFDSDFFATKSDLRRSIENLISKLNKGSQVRNFFFLLWFRLSFGFIRIEFFLFICIYT
jgi:hypothetical protein